MTNATNNNLSWTYGYDVMDRVNAASRIAWQEAFTYDADGNRLTQGGSYSATFSYSPTSNQITSSNYGYGTPGYDPSGNVISVNGLTTGAGTAGYNAAGRVTSIQDASLGLSMTLQYNALGQRIRKTSPIGNTTFVYDEAGHLLGEYDDSGNLIEEMVWLGDTPVATLRPNGSGGVAVYYVHSDHLNSPRKISRPSDNAIVWRWDSDPFGNVFPDENPSGLGTFVSNLAFPGQYIDQETGLFYNNARYYDPGASRYFQSDPIGLGGGINTYAYVGGNPISWSDPLGLQAWQPGMQPPSNIPGGPWTPAGPGQLPGTFYGPKKPAGGGRDMCRYVPDEANGGTPGAKQGYWKTQTPGDPWQRYNLSGNPISPTQAHPGNPPSPSSLPSTPPATPLAFFLWALLHSEPAY